MGHSFGRKLRGIAIIGFGSGEIELVLLTRFRSRVV
jgi:hypothetical protein